MANNIRSVSLSREASSIIDRLVESQGFNFSAWVNNKVIVELEDKEQLIIQRDKISKKLEELNKAIELMERWEKNRPVQVMSKEEVNYCFESVAIIENNPSCVDGRRNYYNNVFHRSISKAEFLRRVEEQKTKVNG